MTQEREGAGEVFHISEGGILAPYNVRAMQPLLIGPTTSSEENRMRLALAPIGCLCLFDNRFEFDSSFVVPEAAQEFREFASLRTRLSDPNTGWMPSVSLFGHADTAGDDNYNKRLSGRRAEAIYAVLTRRVSFWERLYNNPFGGDKWGLRITQVMLNALLYDPRRLDGQMDDSTRAAIRLFQSENGLPQTGGADVGTRHKLCEKYMDFLCRDAQGTPFRLQPTEFLAQGADSGGKGDYQGCSDFNPVLVFSRDQHLEFEKNSDKSDRNTSNAPNRRVLVLLFAPGTKVSVNRWPCPRTAEGPAGCYKRFWSDHKERRRFQAELRLYEKDRNTFACRFYDRLAGASPCERVMPILRIRLYDREHNLLIGAPFVVTTPSKQVSGFSDATGDAVIRNVPVPSTCHVRWSRPAPPETPADEVPPEVARFEFELNVFVELTEDAEETETQVEQAAAAMRQEAARRRLNNLGYTAFDTMEENVKAFQRDCGEPKPSGLLEDIEPQLRQYHDDLFGPPAPAPAPVSDAQEEQRR